MASGSVPWLAKFANHALSWMRDIQSWTNASRFWAVASALSGGEAQEPRVTVGVLSGPVGSADAVLVAAAINTVRVDETSSASRRFGRMGAPRLKCFARCQGAILGNGDCCAIRGEVR